MHQKKIPRVKNILHSIPILRKKVYSKKNSSSLSSFLNNRSIVIKNKHLRYVSSSIPLVCSVALLLLSICIVSPDGFNSSRAYAEGESDLADNAIPLSYEDTTATLTILTGQTTETTPVGMGSGPAFRSHNISYSVVKPTEYALRISYAADNTELKYYGMDGSAPATGGTPITGAGSGVAASSMPTNSWGFAWSDSTDTANADMTYYTMPTGNGGTGIEGGLLKSGTTDVNATGKLTFAANFADDAVAGHYKTQVVLSLAAVPEAVVVPYSLTFDCNGATGGCPDSGRVFTGNFPTDSDTITLTVPTWALTKSGYAYQKGFADAADATAIQYSEGGTITLDKTTYAGPKTVYAVWKKEAAPTDPVYTWDDNLKYMQQMTSEACAAAPSKTPKTLTDSRDGSTYTVAKLDDDKCWMTQNLRIVNKQISSADSNLAEGATYTIRASSSSDTTFAGQNDVYYGNSTVSGAYYGWGTATASTLGSSYSICPKGWKLPSISEYESMMKAAKINFQDCKNGCTGSTSASDSAKIRGKPYNFPYAGNVGNGSLDNVGSNGYYWSSTAYSSDRAYYLSFNSSSVGTYNYCGHYYGFPIRCIAP